MTNKPVKQKITYNILLSLGSLGDHERSCYLCKTIAQANQARDIWLSHSERHTAYIAKLDGLPDWKKNLKCLEDNFLLN